VLKNTPHPEWIENIKAIAKTASEIVADIYHNKKELSIKLKADDSPFTTADLASDQYIRQALKRLTPDIPVISEEMESTLQFPQPPESIFWLVDPLDGTKEFIHRTGEFTVNIALIMGHQAILGVVEVPLKQERYWAEKNKGSYFQKKEEKPTRLSVNMTPSTALTIAISRSHCFEPEYTQFINLAQQWSKEVNLLKVGSALKICLVAQGLADLYPRFGPTSGWDTAAGHIILNEANGYLVDLQGQPLRYGQNATLENPPFIATTPYYLPKVLEKTTHAYS
jgi:3'(2'), 5'-bisphosphate nucleotidase